MSRYKQLFDYGHGAIVWPNKANTKPVGSRRGVMKVDTIRTDDNYETLVIYVDGAALMMNKSNAVKIAMSLLFKAGHLPGGGR